MNIINIFLASNLSDSKLVKYTNNNIINKYLNNFDWNQILVSLTTKVFNIILISILFFFIAKIGKRLIAHFFKNYQKKLDNKKEQTFTGNSINVTKRRNKTMYTLLENAYYYIVIFFYFYSILSIMGIPVGTLIAGAGIFSLAIGLGAQGFVSDIVSGFFILFEHQIDVGDHVIINNINGIVVAVGLRTTQIRSSNGTLNFIPNRSITTISNLSRGNIQAIVDIRITPEAPIQKIENIMADVNKEKAGKNPNVIGDPLIFGTVYLDDGSLAIEVAITSKSSTEAAVQSEYLTAYLDAIKKAGISLPLAPLMVPEPSTPTDTSETSESTPSIPTPKSK
ncbi:mechanosensitive ion channel family protein [Fructilactobacillus lindneri]|nr:mechanosensitive ion channel family protein [Fructilactobacillus lindneri]SJZ73799.1 small conductance mechanosensitive channel [Fructilactobacillus lindneri DSM 20690 = JCM 11027]